MTITELCDRAGLNEEAREMASPNMAIREYIQHLAQSERLRDAIRALAQLLENHDSIAWGLASIQRINTVSAKPAAGTAVRSVEHWLADPNDERRRAAMQAAEQAGFGTAAGLLALAVFLSGGSMAPADAPVSPEPAPHLCARAVTGAMALAVAWEPQNAAVLLRSFLDHGFRVAEQRKIWTQGTVREKG
jgi:hypothetical protein